MTVLAEGELHFTFGNQWHVARFDRSGASWPRGVSPVDFIAEGQSELVLMEIKDPSASTVPVANRQAFVRSMRTRELTDQLVPKARSTYGFLHLMARDAKPMRYVVVIGTENLSIQPALLMHLTDRLRRGLRSEAGMTWEREYVSDCIVVPIESVNKALFGCSARRITL